MSLTSWLLWAVVLFFQNISFTYVSRARASGSLWRHFKACIFSNGIWIFAQMIMLGPVLDYLTGKHGRGPQLLTAAIYTVATVAGSIVAHFWALRTEKGKDAVGANKLYAQVPVGEWQAVKAFVEGMPPEFTKEFERIRRVAEEAHVCAVGALPVTAISATKVGNEIVKSGL